MIIDKTRTSFFGYIFARKTKGGILQWLVALEADYRERRKLAEMPDDQLQDIGLTREEAVRTARLPSWDAPIQFR